MIKKIKEKLERRKLDLMNSRITNDQIVNKLKELGPESIKMVYYPAGLWEIFEWPWKRKFTGSGYYQKNATSEDAIDFITNIFINKTQTLDSYNYLKNAKYEIFKGNDNESHYVEIDQSGISRLDPGEGRLHQRLHMVYTIKHLKY